MILPSWTISAVAEVPGGAHPSYAHGYYKRDNAFYKVGRDLARPRRLSRLDEGQRAAARPGGVRRRAQATRHRRERAMSDERIRSTEMMTVAASRALKSSDVCFVGIGMPSAACNLARLTHAPEHHPDLRVRHHRDQAVGAAAFDRRRRIVRHRAVPRSRCRRCSATGCRAGASPSASSAARRSTGSPTSTPPWSGPMTSRRCGCRAAAARRKSRSPAARSSSS